MQLGGESKAQLTSDRSRDLKDRKIFMNILFVFQIIKSQVETPKKVYMHTHAHLFKYPN